MNRFLLQRQNLVLISRSCESRGGNGWAVFLFLILLKVERRKNNLEKSELVRRANEQADRIGVRIYFSVDNFPIRKCLKRAEYKKAGIEVEKEKTSTEILQEKVLASAKRRAAV